MSEWHSLNPEDATRLADVGQVKQGHPILENIAIAILSENAELFDSWRTTTREAFRKCASENVIDWMSSVCVDFWQMTSEVFKQWKFPKSIDLDGVRLTGFPTVYVPISMNCFYIVFSDFISVKKTFCLASSLENHGQASRKGGCGQMRNGLLR